MRVEQKIAGDDLLTGIGGQAVDARQVGDGSLGMAADDAVLAVHRHTREVADVLVGSGQLVKKRRLAAVLVAGQREPERLAFGNFGPVLAVMVAGGLAQLAHAGMGHRGVALLTAGGAVRLVDVLHFDFRRVVQPQRQLIAAQLDLDGVTHRRDLAQGDLGAGGQAHVQQVVAQLALAADGTQYSILPDFQIRQCHIYNPLSL